MYVCAREQTAIACENDFQRPERLGHKVLARIVACDHEAQRRKLTGAVGNDAIGQFGKLGLQSEGWRKAQEK